MLYHLEALRGICALWVVLAHVPWTILGGVVLHHTSWFPVNVFFVLSGYIMSRTYAAKSEFDARAFMVRRFWRLYPLHVVTMLAFLALIVIRQHVLPALTGMQPSAVLTDDLSVHVFFNALLLHAVGFLNKGLLNSPSWSISTEFWTYALFAGCCMIVRSPSARAALMAGAGAIAFAILWVRFGDLGLGLAVPGGFPRCIACFGLGCLVWLVTSRSQLKLPPRAADALLLTLLVVIGAVLAGSLRHLPARTIATFLIAPTLIVAVHDRASICKCLLETRPLVTLGAWSYSIYMVHMLIAVASGRLVERVWPERVIVSGLDFSAVPPLTGDAMAGLYVITVVAVSALTYQWVETPWRAHGRTPVVLALRDMRSAAE